MVECASIAVLAEVLAGLLGLVQEYAQSADQPSMASHCRGRPSGVSNECQRQILRSVRGSGVNINTLSAVRAKAARTPVGVQ